MSNIASAAIGGKYMPSPVFPPRPRPTIRPGGSVNVDYLPVDLRPGESVTMNALVYAIENHTDPLVEATWTATATNARGTHSGTVDLPTSADLVRPADLISND